MRKLRIRNALLGILTMMSILAVPTEAAERYAPGVHVYKAGPERWFSYPYGASYLKRGKPPYVGPYYGSYYASPYYRDYWNYRSPYYW